MTVDQLAAELQGIGEDFPRDLNEVMLQAAAIIVEEIKANPNLPTDTGALRNSIQGRVQDGIFGISMRDYGYFQNFGVKGTNNTKAQTSVPDIVKQILPPSSGDTYSFNPKNKMIGGDLPFGARVSIHERGLGAKNFIQFDTLAERLAQIINQNLDLQ